MYSILQGIGATYMHTTASTHRRKQNTHLPFLFVGHDRWAEREKNKLRLEHAEGEIGME